MEVFKATDPFPSRRVVGFHKAEPPPPLPPTVGEVAAGATDLWALSLEQQALDLHEAEDAQLVQHLASAADAVDEDGVPPRTPLSDLHALGISQLQVAEDRLTFGEQLHRDLTQARFAEDLEVFSSIVELDETQEVTPEIVDAVLGNGDGLSLEERNLLAAARQLCEVLEGEGVGGTEYRAYEAAEAAFLETRKGKK